MRRAIVRRNRRGAYKAYHYVPASPEELAEGRRLETAGQVKGRLPYWVRAGWPK